MNLIHYYLVGGAITILKNIDQWEGWHPIYEMENKIHVWNHQPVMSLIIINHYKPSLTTIIHH